MIDFTHKKRPEFIQLVLTIAVVCLALGAITPAASAAAYDWEFSVQSPGAIGEIYLDDIYPRPSGGIDTTDLPCSQGYEFRDPVSSGSAVCYLITASDYLSSSDYVDTYPVSGYYIPHAFLMFFNDIPNASAGISTFDPYVRDTISYLLTNGLISGSTPIYVGPFGEHPLYGGGFSIVLDASHEIDPTFLLNVDVVDSVDDYLISVSGFDGTSMSGTAYTIAVSTYSGGYNLPLTSFPMYLGDSPVHLWTTDQTFTLPIYLSDGVTPIDYYCVMSFPADPTATGYPFWWNMTTHGSLEYPFNTTYPPVVLPTPTPLIPSDIIPDPNDLNNTVNFTGWYQDQGFEGNNITAPIYSGLRGWFNDNMIPVFEFFLMPIGSLSSMITESASTSTDAISDSVNQLSIYAAPMNMVGGYVVLLVPDVVWVVVFAALSIGYVVLLIRISTGSIRDTIGRFLGRW